MIWELLGVDDVCFLRVHVHKKSILQIYCNLSTTVVHVLALSSEVPPTKIQGVFKACCRSCGIAKYRNP